MKDVTKRLHGISLRGRITLWYAGMLLITLVVFSVGITVSIEQYLKHSVQRELSTDANSIVNDFLAHIADKGDAWALGEIREAYPPTDDDPFVRISSGSRVFIAPKLPNDLPSPLDALPLDTPTGPEGTFHRFQVGQDTVMVYALPYRASNGTLYRVETGVSLALSRTAVRSLKKLLFLTIPIVLLIGSVGGYILMKRPLRPLLLLTEKAEKIGRKELGERLPVASTADELERLTHSLNRMIDRLEEALAHNHRFSADASHELRTPLTIMRGEMEEMLLLPDLPQQAVENLISTLDEVERMSRIVSSLMTITRLDVGGERMQIQPISLTALVRTTVDQMRLLAVEKGFPLVFEATEEVWVLADPMRLKQVLVNLFDNAIKYTPQIDLISMNDEEDFENGGDMLSSASALKVCGDTSAAVSARVTSTNRMGVLEVTDHGVGIPAEAVPHIFDRFYRADLARTRSTGGVGLGLAIVKSIITAHDGNVFATSVEGVGTTMRIELPLISPASAMAQITGSSAAPFTPAAMASSTKSI